MSFPKSFGVLIFPEFELLDAAGPLEALYALSELENRDFTLSVISADTKPVSLGPEAAGSTPIGFSSAMRWIPTHTFATAPPLDVLLIPGGKGSVDLTKMTLKDEMAPYVDFVRQVYNGTDGREALKYIISVCNGAMFLAAAGVLDGKKATTNKAYWPVITATGKKTHWVANARWVQDGNVWTTSGVSAGVDGTLAWMESLLGKDTVNGAVNYMEWVRPKSADDDPFAPIYSCKDVLPEST